LGQAVRGSQALAPRQLQQQQAQAQQQPGPLRGWAAGNRAAVNPLLVPPLLQQAQHPLSSMVLGSLGVAAGSKEAARVQQTLQREQRQARAGPSSVEGRSRQPARPLQQLLRPQGLRQTGHSWEQGSRLRVQGPGRLQDSSRLVARGLLLHLAKGLHSGEGCSRLAAVEVVVAALEVALGSDTRKRRVGLRHNLKLM
jgi:hypothetical protein